MNVWDLRKGDRFRVDGLDSTFTFDYVDGMYCRATEDTTGKVFNWRGPVLKLEAYDDASCSTPPHP